MIKQRHNINMDDPETKANVQAALADVVEKLLPEYMRDMVADAQLWDICRAVIDEHCVKNGYVVLKTQGYGWQAYKSLDKPYAGRREKLELFATYPDALRYVLNRIIEDNSRE